MKHQSSPLNKNLFSIFIKIIGWLTIQCNRTLLIFKKVTNTKKIKIIYKKNQKKIKIPSSFSFHLNDTVTKYGKNNSLLNWDLEKDVGRDPDSSYNTS